jgi:hypothetical protein
MSKNNIQDVLKEFRNKGVEGSLQRFYGTYLGEVVSNEDPDNLNRLSVVVPEVFPTKPSPIIAMPKGLVAGKDYGFNYVPKSGEYVYISFRFGHVKYPLWEPGYWAIGERPKEFNSDNVGFKFRDGAIILYNEKESKLEVSLPSGERVLMKGGKISIYNDLVSLKEILKGILETVSKSTITTPVGPGFFSFPDIKKFGQILQQVETLMED